MKTVIRISYADNTKKHFQIPELMIIREEYDNFDDTVSYADIIYKEDIKESIIINEETILQPSRFYLTRGVLNTYADGNKIEAIKWYRRMTKIGLKESKRKVEEILEPLLS